MSRSPRSNPHQLEDPLGNEMRRRSQPTDAPVERVAAGEGPGAWLSRRAFLRCLGTGAMTSVFLGFGGCAPAAPAPAAAPKPAAAPPARMRFLQGSESLAWAPVQIAELAGYLKDEGLAFEVTYQGAGGPTANVGAVINRNVEAGGIVGPSLVELRDQGRPVRIIGTVTNQYIANFVLRKDVAQRLGVTENDAVQKKIEALRGLTIGTISIGGGVFLALKYAVAQRGIDLDRDATVTALSPWSAVVAALKAGRIDAAGMTIPFDVATVADGTTIMLLSTSRRELPGLDNLIFTCLYATEHYGTDKTQEEVLVRFLRAIARAQQLLANKTAEAEKVLRAAFANLDEHVYQRSLRDNLVAFNRTPVTSQDLFANTKRFQEAVQKREMKVSFADLIDNSLAERAVRELGVS